MLSLEVFLFFESWENNGDRLVYVKEVWRGFLERER